MDIVKAIAQLKELREDRLSFINNKDDDFAEPFKADVEAIDTVLAYFESFITDAYILQRIEGDRMSLDRFINSVRSDVAKRYNLKNDAEIDAFFLGMGDSAKDNQEALEKRDKMLRDTVAELYEAKRLLKVAVEDIKYLINHAERNGKACERCKYGNEMYCYADNCSNDAKWRHEAEALKLIGEKEEESARDDG